LLEDGVQLYEFVPALDKEDLDKHTDDLAKKPRSI
jgi:putative cardiolipin synthase